MEVLKIEMDPAEASKRLVAYRNALRRRADAEYEAVVQGLEALEAGQACIALQEVIRAGGFDEKMRPRLAVARADRRMVQFQWRRRQSTAVFDARSPRATVRSDTLEVWVDMRRNHELHEWWTVGYSIVPMMPPDGVRKIGGASYLRQHFILWEVEEWADQPFRAIPDRDPFLLRRLGGDLYAVIHEWDLTDLERAVMAGRRDA